MSLLGTSGRGLETVPIRELPSREAEYQARWWFDLARELRRQRKHQPALAASLIARQYRRLAHAPAHTTGSSGKAMRP